MTPSARVAVALATLLVGVVTLLAVVGVFIVISSSRQQQTLDEIRDGQSFQQAMLDEASKQRTLLIECLTLPPKPGMELNEADRVHECQAETEGLRTAAVLRIARTNIYLHQCVLAKAADLEACIAAKEAATPASPP